MIPLHVAGIVGIESQAKVLLYAPRYLWLSDVTGLGVQEISSRLEATPWNLKTVVDVSEVTLIKTNLLANTIKQPVRQTSRHNNFKSMILKVRCGIDGRPNG